MNLREQLLKEHSKTQCTKIVQWVGHNQQHFDELFQHFISDEYRVVQRAAWPISYCVIACPSLLTKHWKTLVINLKKQHLPDAVKRNSLRMIQYIEIPGKYQGELMDICFNYLQTPKEAVAIKVFAMTVLANMATKYPEIKNELKIVIENDLPTQKAAFKNRANKTLKVLENL